MPLINGKLILLLSTGKDGYPTNWSTKSLKMGSSNACDCFIQSDQVDELHCVLQLREDGHACICNVASSEFSTFIDNVRVAESADLNHKSLLTVGNISFRFEYPAYSKWFVADVDAEKKKATPRKSSKALTPKTNTYTVLSHKTNSPTVTPIKSSTITIKTITPDGRLNIRPFITPVPKRLNGKSIRKSTAANNLILSERMNRSKQVSFGPYLSPEQFDQEMPPMVPLKKGATPLLSSRKGRKSNRISESPKEIKRKDRKFSIVSDDSYVTEPDNQLLSKKTSSRLQDISILSMGSSINTSQSSISSTREGLKHIRKSLESKDSPVFYGNRRLSERSSYIYDYSEDNELSLIEDISQKETVQGMDSQMKRGRKSSSMTNASLFSEVGSINSSKGTPIRKSRNTSTSNDASYLSGMEEMLLTPTDEKETLLTDVNSLNKKSLQFDKYSLISGTSIKDKTNNRKSNSTDLMRSSDDLSLISIIEDKSMSLKRSGRKSSSLSRTRNSVSKENRGSMLMKSTRDSSAEFDDSSLSGVKELVKTAQATSMRLSYSAEDLSLILNEEETNHSLKKSSRKSSAFLDNSNLSGVKQLLKTPKTQKSMRLSGAQDLMKSAEDLSLISNNEGTNHSLKRSSRKSSAFLDNSNLSGVKQLLKTPKIQKSMRLSGVQDLMKSAEDLSLILNEEETNHSLKKSSRKSSAFLDNSNLSGVKQLLKTPKTQKSMRLSDAQDLMKSAEDLSIISNEEETKHSLKKGNRKSSALLDNSNLSVVKQLLKTPKTQKSMRLSGVQDLMKSAEDLSLISNDEGTNHSLKRSSRKSSAFLDNSHLSGVKQLQKTPKTQKSMRLSGAQDLMKSAEDLSLISNNEGTNHSVKRSSRKSSAFLDNSNLSGVKQLLKTPKTQKSMRLSDVQELMKSAEDLSLISNNEGTNHSVKRSNRKSSAFLDNSNLSGVKQLLKTPKTQKSMRLSGVQDLMRSAEDLSLILNQEETDTHVKRKGRKSSRSLDSSSISTQEKEVNQRSSNVRTSSIPLDASKTAKLNKTDNIIKIDKIKFIGDPRSFSTPKPAQRPTDMDADEATKSSQSSSSKDRRNSSFTANLSSIVNNVPENEWKAEISAKGDDQINISKVSEKETLYKSRRSKSVTDVSEKQNHSVVHGSYREVKKSQSILNEKKLELNASKGSGRLELSEKVILDVAKMNSERKSKSLSTKVNLLKRKSFDLNLNNKSDTSMRNERASSSNLDEMNNLSSTRKGRSHSSHSKVSKNATKTPSAKEVERVFATSKLRKVDKSVLISALGEKVDLPLEVKVTRNKRQIVSDIDVILAVKRTKKETREIEEPLIVNLRTKGKHAKKIVEKKHNTPIRDRKEQDHVQIAEITIDKVNVQGRKGKLKKYESIEDKAIVKKALARGRRGKNLEDATETVPEVVKRPATRGRKGKNVDNDTALKGITETAITTKEGLRGTKAHVAIEETVVKSIKKVETKGRKKPTTKMESELEEVVTIQSVKEGLRGAKAPAVIEETAFKSIKKVETKGRKKPTKIMESEPEEVVIIESVKNVGTRGRRGKNGAEETVNEGIEVAENMKTKGRIGRNAKDEITNQDVKKVGTRGRKRKNDDNIIEEEITKEAVITTKRGKKAKAEASMEDNLVIEATKRVGTRSKKVVNENNEKAQNDKLVVETSKVAIRRGKPAVADNDVFEESKEETRVPRQRRNAADTETEIKRPLNTRSTRNRK